MKTKQPERGVLSEPEPTPRVPSGSQVARRPGHAGSTSVRVRLGVGGITLNAPAGSDETLQATTADDADVGVAFDETLCGDATTSPPPARPSEDRSGAWSEKLRVGDEIGRGGMAVVHRAFDDDLRRELAVKVSASGPGGSEGELLRFVEEAQITAQLEHPNVVPVHDLGIDPGGRPYFTMKLVRGESLESILRKRREGDPDTVAKWGLRRLLDVFSSVCQAMEYAHARGVIHRDLKPANIMVGDFGEVLVMDWGVAKVRGRSQIPRLAIPSDVETVRSGQQAHQTVSGTVLGTPS